MEHKTHSARWLISLIIIVLLTACSNPSVEPPLDVGKNEPELNPNPKYYMTIKGYLDPLINKKNTLNFIANYRTSNPACKYIMNSLEGVSSDRYETLTIPSGPNAAGNFMVKIPLDRYIGGMCGWHLLNIDYQLKGDKLNYLSRIAFFSEDSANKQYAIHDELKCNGTECFRIVPPYFSTEYLLSTKSNYIFNLDIYWGNND